MPQCQKCGFVPGHGTKFCPECGAPVEVAPSPATEENNVEGKTVRRAGEPAYGVFNLEDLPPGHIIDDRYEIKEKLGQGGFGAVYRAHDRNMDIDKALKVIPEVVVNDEEAMADLQREARTMIALEHPNIVRVYDFHYAGKIKYIDMAYIDGKTLTKIKIEYPNKRVPEEKVRELASQIAKGLAYAHDQGVIHKDIKPQNIMVTTDGQVKIMDFGIAETVRTSMSRVEQSSSSGTLVYMSPEQLRGKDVGKEADIYSFGAVLYELLSGHPPFYKGDIQYQILNEEPEELEGVSSELNQILRTCLLKAFQERYGSFEELIKVLGGDVTSIRTAAEKQSGRVQRALGKGGIVHRLADVSIITKPEGAKVWLDGEALDGSTPINVEWRTGTVQLRIEMEGCASVEEQIQILEHDINRFQVELETILGSITVQSEIEGQEIWLDAQISPHKTPYTFENLIPGDYTITIAGADYCSRPEVVSLHERETLIINPKLIEYSYLQIDTNYKELFFLDTPTKQKIIPSEVTRLVPGDYKFVPSLEFLPTIDVELIPGDNEKIDYDSTIPKIKLIIKSKRKKVWVRSIHKDCDGKVTTSIDDQKDILLLPGKYRIKVMGNIWSEVLYEDEVLAISDHTIDLDGKIERMQQDRVNVWTFVIIVCAVAIALIFAKSAFWF